MYRSFVGNCLIREMEFRWHFILYSLINLIWMVLALMTFVFIYGHVSLIGSWTLPQMLLLTATFYFFDRVFDTLFEINFSRLNHMVNQGELDLVLTKPVSGQFLVSLRYFSFASLFGAVSMLGLIIWLLARYFWPLALGELLIYALLIGLGLVIIYSWWFSTLLLVFWLGNIPADLRSGADSDRYYRSDFKTPVNFCHSFSFCGDGAGSGFYPRSQLLYASLRFSCCRGIFVVVSPVMVVCPQTLHFRLKLKSP